MSLVFDTLKLSKTLGRVFTPEQAEVLTEALTINLNEGLATKADLALTKAELKAEIADVRGEIAALDTKLTGEIAEVRGEIAALDTKLTGEIGKVRGEIAALETKLTAKIAAVETMIANVRADLIRWFVSTLAANILAMVAISITVAKLVAHQ